MGRNNTGKSAILFVSLFAFVLFFSPSCKKNEDCGLTITLLDASSNGPIAGATIQVHPSQTSGGNLQKQDQTSTTDGSGIVHFTFTLPAMLEVTITPPSPYTAPATSPLVKLEAGKTVSKTISL